MAWLIVTDRVEPIEGAKRIERIHWWEPPEMLDLAFMSGFVDEWDGEWGRGRPAVEREIRRLAEEILEEREVAS